MSGDVINSNLLTTVTSLLWTVILCNGHLVLIYRGGHLPWRLSIANSHLLWWSSIAVVIHCAVIHCSRHLLRPSIIAIVIRCGRHLLMLCFWSPSFYLPALKFSFYAISYLGLFSYLWFQPQVFRMSLIRVTKVSGRSLVHKPPRRWLLLGWKIGKHLQLPTVMTDGTPPGNRFSLRQGLVTCFFCLRKTTGTGFLLVNRQRVTGNRVVINSVLEDGEADKGGTQENEREESDALKMITKCYKVPPISTGKTLRLPAFITCTHPGNRSQKGLTGQALVTGKVPTAMSVTVSPNYPRRGSWEIEEISVGMFVIEFTLLPSTPKHRE